MVAKSVCAFGNIGRARPASQYWRMLSRGRLIEHDQTIEELDQLRIEVAAERARAEELLDNLMPASIAEELRKSLRRVAGCSRKLPVRQRSCSLTFKGLPLEMQATAARIKLRSEKMRLPALELRVGVHIGPVISGVVGNRRISFDIRGDAVNTASLPMVIRPLVALQGDKLAQIRKAIKRCAYNQSEQRHEAANWNCAPIDSPTHSSEAAFRAPRCKGE
jgi:hypothetical protein